MALQRVGRPFERVGNERIDELAGEQQSKAIENTPLELGLALRPDIGPEVQDGRDEAEPAERRGVIGGGSISSRASRYPQHRPFRIVTCLTLVIAASYNALCLAENHACSLARLTCKAHISENHDEHPKHLRLLRFVRRP